MAVRDEFPDNVRDLPLPVQVAVLYERVKNLSEDVQSLRRTLWVFISAIISGAVLFLFSVANGWLSHKPGSGVGDIVQLTLRRWVKL